MINPVLRVRLSIQGCRLDVDILVCRIKVHVADCGGFACERRGDGDALKVRWDDKVHVLAWVGEESHHGECKERSHCSAVIVARKAIIGWCEEGGDVEMGSQG